MNGSFHSIFPSWSLRGSLFALLNSFPIAFLSPSSPLSLSFSIFCFVSEIHLMPGIFISYPFNPIYGIFFCFYSQFCFICRVHHKTIFITFFVISMSTDYYFPLMSVQSQLIQTPEIDVLAGFWIYMILKSHLFDTYCNELWFSKNIYRTRGYVQASTKITPSPKTYFLLKITGILM